MNSKEKNLNRSVKKFTFILAVVVISISAIHAQPQAKTEKQLKEYFGVQVNDPYAWMEDVSADEVQEWIKDQDQYTLQKVRDENWELIRKKIDALGKTGDGYSVPIAVEEYLFYQVFEPDQTFGKLYRADKNLENPKLVFDPAQHYDDSYSIGGYAISPEGQYAVFLEREGQPRWGYLRIVDLESGELLPSKISGVRSPAAKWARDGKKFYYQAFGDTKELLAKKTEPKGEIREVVIKKGQTTTASVYNNNSSSSLMYSTALTNDLNYLVVSEFDGTSNENNVVLISTKNNKITPLHTKSGYKLNFFGSNDSELFFYSNKASSNGEVVSINLKDPSKQLKTIIPGSKDILAGGSTAGGNAMNLIGDHLVLLYRFGTHQYLKVYDLKGNEKFNKELETGWIGSGIVGHRNGDQAWFSLNTFLDPSTVYNMDLKSGKISKFFDRKLPIDPADYVTTNTYFTSKDGTEVPIYIAHKKDLKMDGSNPVFMYGYGFGGWVAVPWYQPHMLAWLEMGGIYVLPGVRGGGEFGDEWKEAGIRFNRQNAIDDYIFAAKYLIDQKYTSEKMIVANGWSASGSLAAAAVQQAPHIFGAALIGIPSLDLLKYLDYTEFKGWSYGYGDPTEKEGFEVLYGWSPYHNIKANICYPPMLVTVGEKDPVTPPQHGYKFVAAMQANQTNCGSQTMLKVVWGGGHGFGVNGEDNKDTFADELNFLATSLGIKNYEKLRLSDLE